MLTLRPYFPSDLDALKAMHSAQGLDYALPDPNDPTLIVRGIVEENGRVTDALLLRKTAEAFWIFNPTGRRRERLSHLMLLQSAMTKEGLRAGFRDVHAWLPPQLAKQPQFVRLLERFGWREQAWPCFHFEPQDNGGSHG
jgi:hypothetical protein